MKSSFAIIFIGLFFKVHLQPSLLCSKEFCKDYTAKQDCRKIPEACTIQNATHNGLELPSPVPCNCCDFCLENLDDGDSCAVGDPSSPMPTTICGDDLSCTATANANPTCEKMVNTLCTQAQVKYDDRRNKGELGFLEERPVCDRNGLYKPYMCISGEICFCVSEDGKKIFGEIPFTETPEYILRCECSRNYHKAVDIRNRNLHRNEFLRCQPNGDYDTLQCIDDKCLCVDAEDGHPTYPNIGLVNITSISATTLPCFNNETHMEADYYRDCEALYIEQINFTKTYEAEGFEVLGHTLPNCQLDGYYASVQETSKTKYCSDPHGKMLEKFEVLLTEPLAANMDCKCARARSIMIEDEQPECCRNGNYKKIQCRRGVCYCVNENGIQIGKEVEYLQKEMLHCARPRIEEFCD